MRSVSRESLGGAAGMKGAVPGGGEGRGAREQKEGWPRGQGRAIGAQKEGEGQQRAANHRRAGASETAEGKDGALRRSPRLMSPRTTSRGTDMDSRAASARVIHLQEAGVKGHIRAEGLRMIRGSHKRATQGLAIQPARTRLSSHHVATASLATTSLATGSATSAAAAARAAPRRPSGSLMAAISSASERICKEEMG